MVKIYRGKKRVDFTGGISRIWSRVNETWILVWKGSNVLRMGKKEDLDKYVKWDLGATRK